MSHLSPGLISAYNSLTDKHLAGYFSNTRIRRHLQRAGLITRSGRIVPDKEYRHKLIQRAHQRHVRECLAQAIFHKVLEMERLHQIEIKRKLEEFARRERVHKIKVERSKRCEEDVIRILSPHPPMGARSIQKQLSGPEAEHSESSESPSSSRPNTAPGKMQRPVRLKPIYSNSTTAPARRSTPYRPHETPHKQDQPFNCTMDKESRGHLTTMEASRGISPYCLPVINNFLTPVPPTTKRKARGVKVTPSITIRGRRLLPTTASSGADVTEDPPWLRSSVHQSRVCVNMVYFGKTVHLSHDFTDMRDEVKVFQQHCGGENLCVYKGKLREGETFQFLSRRHRGFPFSLTFFLNGLQVERLSSCCEFKHRKGSRLGGKHGHFGFTYVEGASPCYKCIIAMGLDKKPSPPPKKVKEDKAQAYLAASPKNSPEMETERTAEDSASPSMRETSEAHEMETQVEEKTAPEEHKVRDDYEEDFEADDESPAEKPEVKEEKSPSPTCETERQVPERDASETEDEIDESRSGSSFSGSDLEESDAEATKDSKEDDNHPKEENQEEEAAPVGEKDEPNPVETAATEVMSALAKGSDIQDSAGDSTEIEISDTSVPSANGNKPSEDSSGDQNNNKMAGESKNEEDQERAKSVQEKLAEAILKESQCSSEPELSDTSTEEEEEPTDKGPQQDNEAQTAEQLVTHSEQQQTKCEESGTDQVAQEQEELSETEKQTDAEQRPCDTSESSKDERVSEVAEDEKAAEDEATAKEGKSEEPGEAQLCVNEENVAQDDKTADPLEEAGSADAETAENDEEREEKTTVEATILPIEMGQGAKSREEDELLASEPSEKTDETAVPDNAEVEAEAVTASETMEIKAESPEAQEALSCEDAPENDTERRQEADCEDRAAASDTEVTAEHSNSSPEETGDTTVENTADINEENTKDDESSKDGSKEVEAQATSRAEASKDDSQQEKSDETMEKSVEVDEKIEKLKSKEDSEEEEKETQIHLDEILEDENNQERENKETEEESNDKNKKDESMDKTESIVVSTEDDTNTEGRDKEEVDKALDEDDKVVNEEKVEEPEKKEESKYCESVQNINVKTEPEANGNDKSPEGEERTESIVAAAEKDDQAEKSENSENEDKVAETKDDEECQEEKDGTEKTTEAGEISKITEKSEDANLEGNVRICSENIVESENVREAAGDIKAVKIMNVTEADNDRGETEETGEKGEIDAENGEISVEAERNPHEQKEEAPGEEKMDLKTTGQAEEERKTEDPTGGGSSKVKEVRAESGDISEDNKFDWTPDADTIESDIKELAGTEMSGMESKEDPKEDERKEEEKEPVENSKKSDCESRDSDLIENNNNFENNTNEVATSGDLEESSAQTTVGEGGTANQFKHAHTDESAVGADHSAADGENGVDTEEGSKASEEGASVLLKPQAQSSEAGGEEQSVAVHKETPEALAREDNTDLVTNWINMHQTSKFFETFVEPLEDLTEDAGVSNSNGKEAPSTELPRSESPVKTACGDEEKEHEPRNEKESRVKTRTEAVESDLNSMPAEDYQYEDDAATATSQLEEKTEVESFIPTEEYDQSNKEFAKYAEKPQEHKGSSESLEENKAQDGPSQETHEENAFSKTEVESFSGSVKPEAVIQDKGGDNAADNGPESNLKQTATGLSFKTQECQESKSPDGLKDAEETWDKTDNQSRQVTETSDFTASKSDDGSQQESDGESIQPEAAETSFSGERRDVQLIQEIKHTLSKDRLSTFSVDETLFSHSSYPLLTAARTESGH
ncbi:glutamate-rich protein 3 [Leuresthes tenuis]|uniref:glutamate-rich protein 3 n=1 Tax=Leuresthes tenuis TaxID=355514 RepID=UPI003B50B4E4